MASAFQLEELDRQVALVTFDLPGKKVNTMGRAVLKELAELVGAAREAGPTCGVSCSAASPASSSPGPT